MPEPSRKEIENRAYELWEKNGRPEGRIRHCSICFGIGWVCENHPSRAWSETLGCMCGAGMPCRCNDVEQPDTSEVIEPHDQLLSSDFSDGDHLIRSQAPDGGSESFGTHASVKIAISSDPIGRVLSKWPSRSARPFGDSTQRGPLRRRG